MRLFPLGRGDLAFDGKGDAVGAWDAETGSIASNLIGYCSAMIVGNEVVQDVPCASGMSIQGMIC